MVRFSGPRRRRSTTTAPTATSSFIARSTLSTDRFRNRRANVARDGIRAPEDCPYRSSTEYNRNAASETSASITHSGTIANR
ncbi:MAG: hypothetical protein ACRDPT_02955 [Streptomycetales bacterium]